MSASNYSRREPSAADRFLVTPRLDDHWRRVRLRTLYTQLKNLGASMILTGDHGGAGLGGPSVAAVPPETRTGIPLMFSFNNIDTVPRTNYWQHGAGTGQLVTAQAIAELNNARAIDQYGFERGTGNLSGGFTNSGAFAGARGLFVILRVDYVSLGGNGSPLLHVYDTTTAPPNHDHYPWVDYTIYNSHLTVTRPGIAPYFPMGQFHAYHVGHTGSNWFFDHVMPGRHRRLLNQTDVGSGQPFVYSNPNQQIYTGGALGTYPWSGKVAMIVTYGTSGVANATTMLNLAMDAYGLPQAMSTRFTKAAPKMMWFADEGSYSNTGMTTFAPYYTPVLRWKDQGSTAVVASCSNASTAPVLNRVPGTRDKVGMMTGNAIDSTFTHTYNRVSTPGDFTCIACIRMTGSPYGSFTGVFSEGSMMMLATAAGNNWGTYSSSQITANTQIPADKTCIIEMCGNPNTGGDFYFNGVNDGSFSSTTGQGPHIGGIPGQQFSGRIYSVLYFDRKITDTERACIVKELTTEYGPLNTTINPAVPYIFP